MAIIKDGIKTFEGAAIKLRERYWLDGMLEEYAARIAGCHNENGNVIWIKAEYLKNLMPYKSPCAAERKKYIKAYIKEHIDAYIINIAKSKY